MCFGGGGVDLPLQNRFRPYVGIMRLLDLKGRPDDGEETALLRQNRVGLPPPPTLTLNLPLAVPIGASARGVKPPSRGRTAD